MVINNKCQVQTSTFSCAHGGSSTGSGVTITCRWASNNSAADGTYSFNIPGGYTSSTSKTSSICVQANGYAQEFNNDVNNNADAANPYPASTGYASSLDSMISYLESAYPNCFSA